MRKVIAVLAVGAIALSLASPAAAGGKKKKKGTHVHESFTATALPLPNLSGSTGTSERGCFAGQEGVHKVSTPFEAPGKGTLRLYMENFTGDWDLQVKDSEGRTIGESLNNQIDGGAPPEEEVNVVLTKGQQVQLVTCNWLGAPQAEVHYEGHFV